MDEVATVVVQVRSITSRPVRKRGMKPLVTAVVADATGTMEATFFNQPWLQRKYAPGTRLLLSGKYQARNRFRVQFHAETGEEVGAASDEMATYPATDGLSTTQILALARQWRGAAQESMEPLPARLRMLERLPDRAAALDAAHFGDHEGGRRRLAFEELLLVQIALLRRRARRREGARAEPLEPPAELTRSWLEDSLPFSPTGDQRAAMAAVDEDLAAGRPMQRLLMGEVGSGKTVVALYAMLRAVESGAQAALMAPTETLAEQHFATLQALMPGALVQAALLTGSTPGARRTDLLGKLASGELKLLVGTHALIEDAVAFDRLGVVVVDEQHRFGVNQRRALDRKAPEGVAPHVLHMTATPIPRTLALTAYGDLDVTVLRELPAGRRPIETYVAPRRGALARLRPHPRRAATGRQAFVVCPLVEESEARRRARPRRSTSGCGPASCTDYAWGCCTAAQAAREGGGDGGLRRGRGGRAGRDDRHRGRHRRPERVRDAGRERGALRDLPAAPVARAHRSRAARLAVPAVRAQGVRAAARAGRAPRRLQARRDRPRAARRGRDARHPPVRACAQFEVARLPDDAELLERARMRGQAILDADPALAEPEHVLLEEAVKAAYGADALEPIPA